MPTLGVLHFLSTHTKLSHSLSYSQVSPSARRGAHVPSLGVLLDGCSQNRPAPHSDEQSSPMPPGSKHWPHLLGSSWSLSNEQASPSAHEALPGPQLSPR